MVYDIFSDVYLKIFKEGEEDEVGERRSYGDFGSVF